MIAFNKDLNNDSDPLKKLEDILYKIYKELDSEEVYEEDVDFENTNLSELLEIVYFHLFTEHYSEIDLSIKKENNNSLSIKINDLK